MLTVIGRVGTAIQLELEVVVVVPVVVVVVLELLVLQGIISGGASSNSGSSGVKYFQFY